MWLNTRNVDREKHYLKHHTERILPNSFGLSNAVEGESGYCRDHLETREKDAGVLTEDRGRVGGNSRTCSLVFGPEHPSTWMRSSPPISATARHHQELEDTISANITFGFTTGNRRHLTLRYKNPHSAASSEETPSRHSYNTSRPAPTGFIQHWKAVKKPLLLCILLQKVCNSLHLSPHKMILSR